MRKPHVVLVTLLRSLMVVSSAAAIETSAIGDVPDCQIPGIMVGRAPSPEYQPETWGRGEFLASDFLSRSQPHTPRFSDHEYANFGLRLEAALSVLAAAVPDLQLSAPMSPYFDLLVQVEFIQQVRDELEAFAPSIGERHARRIPIPVPFLSGLGSVCTQVCSCWIDVGTDGGRAVTIYLPRRSNVIFAVHELRRLAETTSAHVVRRWRSVGGISSGQRVPVDSVEVRIVDDTYYFTVATTNDSAETKARKFIVADRSVREVSTADLPGIPAFEAFPLPIESGSH